MVPVRIRQEGVRIYNTLVEHDLVLFDFGLGHLLFDILSDLVRIEHRNLMLLSQGCGDLIKEILFENVKVQFVVLYLKCLTEKQWTLHSTFLFSLVNDAVSVEVQLLKFQTCRYKLAHMTSETAPMHTRYYWSAARAGGIWSGWYVKLCT